MIMGWGLLFHYAGFESCNGKYVSMEKIHLQDSSCTMKMDFDAIFVIGRIFAGVARLV